MKFPAKLFVVLFLFLVAFACTKNENKEKIEEKRAEQIQAATILEISQDARGMWGIEGKTLFFRLFENRIAEYEYADVKKVVPRKINRAETVNSSTKTKISDSEFQEITGLLDALDPQKIGDEYPRKCCCTDASLDFKIDIKFNNNRKNISLNGYCSLGEVMYPQVKQTADFPKSLAELIKIVDKTRRKYQPE